MTEPVPPAVPIHRLPVYNPGRLSDAEITASFVVRHDLLARIQDDLAGELEDSRPQHHLIVGQRGMGKTSLLLRLAAELRRDPLAGRFVPLTFAEEQYSVDRLSKFWCNCLDSLADACDRMQAEAQSAAIDAEVAELSRQIASSGPGDHQLARAALDAFVAAALRTGRRPVLLVDNIQLVFERIGKAQQHQLREALLRPGAPILVAASPSPPTQDYGAAFYDHFKTHYLRPLDLGEMRILLTSLARAAGRPAIATQVEGHPARIATLHALTGGTPRTGMLLFHIYAEDSAPTVFGELERLLDDMTPWYKARLEELPAQMQVVLVAMADHWDPLSSAELGAQTGLLPNQISPQLNRLIGMGLVERVELARENVAGYQAAERFFNVWFLMRSASRRRRRSIEFLTRFLESFHEAASRRELDQAAAPNIALDPNDADAWSGLGDLLGDVLGRTQEAEQAAAVLLHLGQGAALLALLQERGDHLRLRPWYQAIRAQHLGARRHLLDVAVEVRPAAEWFFDQIERRRSTLPATPRRETSEPGVASARARSRKSNGRPRPRPQGRPR